jgi:hypothetical protein
MKKKIKLLPTAIKGNPPPNIKKQFIEEESDSIQKPVKRMGFPDFKYLD